MSVFCVIHYRTTQSALCSFSESKPLATQYERVREKPMDAYRPSLQLRINSSFHFSLSSLSFSTIFLSLIVFLCLSPRPILQPSSLVPRPPVTLRLSVCMPSSFCFDCRVGNRSMRAGSGAVTAEPGAEPCTGLPDPTTPQWPSPDGPTYARALGSTYTHIRRSGMRIGLLLGQIDTDSFLTAIELKLSALNG